MLIEIILALLIGVTIGTLTGLIPGIHINLIGLTLVSLSSKILTNSSILPIYLICFVVAMSITHTFLDFIPSIFLGAPDTDTELSVLPGHELLKQGQGYKAVLLSNYGSLAAIFILILISVPCIFLIPKIHSFIEKILPFILISISLILIFSEKNKISAFFVFMISGILGYITLNLQNLQQPLFPLLTGLFGGSMLILSIKNKTQIPPQEIKKPRVKIFKPLIGSVIASPLCSFLPGLGSGQAAIIANQISKTDKEGFLILLGATNTLVMGFSFISLYLISKTRTGSAVTINQILPNLNFQTLILILTITLLTGLITFPLTNFLAKIFSQKISKINYTYLSLSILIFLTIIILIFSKFLGILIFIISILTGTYGISLKVKRTNLMGCLLIPTIILYLI